MSGTYRCTPVIIAGGQSEPYVIWNVPKMDLSTVNRVPIPTYGFNLASISWAPASGSWGSAVITIKVSNNNCRTVDNHPSGYVIGGVAVSETTQNTCDGIPLEHGWLVLEVTTVEASQFADLWVCMKKVPA